MRKPSRGLVIALVACLVFCLVLALDLIPGLRGDFGWRWPYAVPDWPRLLPAIITLLVYLAGVSRIKRPAPLLLWCLAGAVAIPIACLFILDDPLYSLVTRTLSGLATGAHLAGAEIHDPAAAASAWPTIMPTYLQPGQHTMLSVHVALSPPGLPLFYAALNRLLEGWPALAEPLGMALRPYQCQNYAIMAYDNAQLASAWFGILMPLWAGLTVFPLYRAGGRLAIMWWPLVPSLALFTPTWNTLYPLLGLIAYLLLAAALSSPERRIRAGLFALASGVVVSVATFANISMVPMIGFLGLYAGIVLLQRFAQSRPLPQTSFPRQAAISALFISLLFVIGLASVWIVYYLLSEVTPIAILAQALGQHLGLNRPYLPWVYLHLYDLALFTGFPVVVVALALVARRIPVRRPFDLKAVDPLGAALALTLIALAVSGTARGETGRVWLFFVPYLLILAARWFGDPARPGVPGKPGVWLVTAVQAITLITLAAFLRVMSTELTPPPASPPVEQAAQAVIDALSTPATFAGRFTLIGAKATAAGDGIDLTLSWRADQRAAVPYYLSALIIKPDGQPLPPAADWQPFDTRYPVTCWQPGQVITETRHLSPGAALAPGAYWISLSAFDARDGKRAPVTRPGQPDDTQLGLGPIPVP
jgi:hypothetical protein